jgi:hypothetical protein
VRVDPNARGVSRAGPSAFPVAPLDGNRVFLEAWTRLDARVYSHLNSFSWLLIDGHRALGVGFSPCPAQVIALTHADYPSGAPARFAYLDRYDVFRVVQASDAEKGPFTTLCEGKLARGQPLSVVLYELTTVPHQPLAIIDFDDWSSQLSTQLSPTAGCGVAENAVEFGLGDERPSSTAHLALTLAGTGIGRGWDSVAHAPGVYRNRVRIQRLAE